MDVVQALHDRSGSVLIIGFGRFGQVMSQLLLARDIAVTIIDNDIDMVRSAEEFGFRIFFGDGTRLDVLHASGAATARAIAVCTDDRAVTSRIVALVREAFPQAKVLARSFDREHALQLVKAGVDYQIRETFESALRFGQAALVEMGVDADEAARTAEQVRRLDGERFDLELAAGDIRAGFPPLIGNTAPGTPTPLSAPRRESQVLNPSSPVNLEDP